jgi:hypothetical protein
LILAGKMTVECKQEQVIIKEGNIYQNLYRIEKGKVRFETRVANIEKKLITLEAGE